jgi:hypothetical protein
MNTIPNVLHNNSFPVPSPETFRKEQDNAKPNTDETEHKWVTLIYLTLHLTFPWLHVRTHAHAHTHRVKKPKYVAKTYK